jgi:hypothetical protein
MSGVRSTGIEPRFSCRRYRRGQSADRPAEFVETGLGARAPDHMPVAGAAGEPTA